MNSSMMNRMLGLNFFMLEINVTKDVRHLIVKESAALRNLGLHISSNMYFD